VNATRDHVIHNKKHYNNDNINWSVDTQKTINHNLKIAEDPKSFDPIWVLKLSSKESYSANFQ
jgi:hypothetical protein